MNAIALALRDVASSPWVVAAEHVLVSLTLLRDPAQALGALGLAAPGP